MRRFRRQFHFESCASGRSWRRAILECFQPRTVAGAGADLPQIEFSDLQHRDDIFRATCPLGRLPDFQVNLPAADSRRPRSNHRCMLPDNGFANFLSLPFKGYLFPFVAASGLVGEGSLAIWLLMKGVNVQRWKEQASLGV